MRFARLQTSHGPTYARLDGAHARLLPRAPWLPPLAGGSKDGDGTLVPYQNDDLLCPVEPTKIVCVGRNYVAHAKELGNEVPKEPLLFFKPPSSLIGPNGVIVLPRQSERVEHESELGVVIGTRARNVLAKDALSYVFGYTAANDVTARDLQKKDGQWTRAKGFDTFCPVGPWIETELDPAQLTVVCRVNGAVRQDGKTSDMVFAIGALIEYVSAAMTLEPGDLILTGTPEGVGPLTPGDRCEVEIRNGEGADPVFLLQSMVSPP